MNEIIKLARHQLGEFFKQRRQLMGHTEAEFANFVGITANTIRGIESGRFAMDIDLHFAICSALEIKPFFAPLEEIGKGSLPPTTQPRFMLCPDKETGQLYILHRDFPACLIQVIQTTPVTFKVVDIYDTIDEEELAIHPFMNEAKEFFRAQINNPEDLN